MALFEPLFGAICFNLFKSYLTSYTHSCLRWLILPIMFDIENHVMFIVSTN